MGEAPASSDSASSADEQPRAEGRCHWCGYALRGLPQRGTCPECGTEYSPETAARLTPAPSVAVISLRLGWPLLGLTFAVFTLSAGAANTDGAVVFVILGYAMLLAVPFNSYFQVRSMLKRHLPGQQRTRGFIAFLRGLGTVVCVVAALVFFVPLILLGACLFMEI